MAEQRLFQAPNMQLGQLAQGLADWYRSQKFEIQVLDAPGGGIVVQARQEEAWRSVLGMSATLNILLRQHDESNLIVEIGAGKWADKAVAAGIGAFVLWPLAFTAGYGAWQQSHLPQRTFDFIQNYIATGGSISADLLSMQATQRNDAARYANITNMGGNPGVSNPGVGNPGVSGGNMVSNTPYAVPPVAPPPASPQFAAPAPTPLAIESGTNTAPAGGAPSARPRFCSNCGAPLGENARFCGGCGSKVE